MRQAYSSLTIDSSWTRSNRVDRAIRGIQDDVVVDVHKEVRKEKGLVEVDTLRELQISNEETEQVKSTYGGEGVENAREHHFSKAWTSKIAGLDNAQRDYQNKNIQKWNKKVPSKIGDPVAHFASPTWDLQMLYTINPLSSDYNRQAASYRSGKKTQSQNWEPRVVQLLVQLVLRKSLKVLRERKSAGGDVTDDSS